MTGLALRYRLIVCRALLAHKLADLAQHLMPSGHDKGRFERPAEDMRTRLAFYGAQASRMAMESVIAKAKCAAVATVFDDLRAEKNYLVADKLKDALSVSWGPQIRELGKQYDLRFEVLNAEQTKIVRFKVLP